MIIKQWKKTHSSNTIKHSSCSFIKQHSCKGLSTRRYLSLTEAYPTTSYVAATFHPTIGQCAHQSLSNTATPELGMIPQGIRGN